jgi:DNA-binding IclR family transcriptional regulator
LNKNNLYKDDLRYKTFIDLGRILALFEDGKGEEKSVSNIAQSLPILPSKASRMLKTLEHIGLFERNHETGRYRIGGRFLQVGLLYTLNHPLRRIILPHLEHIYKEHGLTASWAIFTNDRIIIVDRVGAKEGSKVHLLGSSPPLYSSSYGKVFLAHLDPEERDRVLQSLNLIKFTPRTITDLKTIREELGLVRNKGYSFDIGESIEDIQSMCAPIINQHRDVVAGLAIGSRGELVPAEKFLSFAGYLTEKALFISRQLGYIPWGHDAG